MKTSSFAVLGNASVALILGMVAGGVSAAPAAINVAGKSSVTFVVNGLSNVAGFGGHFSTGSYEDGWGGLNVECHLGSGTVAAPATTVVLVCYDGYQSPTEHDNMFRLDLGPKKENGKAAISHIALTVSNRGVQVDAVRIATNPYTSETKPYTISSFFPLREAKGFFSTGTIYYDNDGNGVLSNDSTRQGTGYSLPVPVVR